MKVYLGAGSHRLEGFVHVDAYPFEGIDHVCDIAHDKLPFEDNSVDYVYSQDFMEHIPPETKVHVINEIWRVLKVGGRMEHYIPNAGSRNDYGSPSHLSHWNLQQFEHFDKDSYRWEKDRHYEGFIGAFKKVLAEEVNWKMEYFGLMPQSIHVVYEKVNV